MHIQGEAQKKTKEGSELWRRAPIWRWSLIGATISTGLLVLAQFMPEQENVEITPRVMRYPQNETRTAIAPTATPPVVSRNDAPAMASASEPKHSNVHSPQQEIQSDLRVSPGSQPSQNAEQSSKHASQQSMESPGKAIAHTDSTNTRYRGHEAEASHAYAQPADADACDTRLRTTSPPLRHFILKVVGFMPRSEALTLLDQTQKQVGMQISPRYVDNQRALLMPISARVPRATVALVPNGMEVKIGDIVDYTSGFKMDSQFPCHYVPNLIDHVVANAQTVPASALGSKDTNNE